MKTRLTFIVSLIVTLALLAALYYSVWVFMGDFTALSTENKKLKGQLKTTEEKLLQCADCCNQMNIRMSEWYVRKDSIIYDFYLRTIKQ